MKLRAAFLVAEFINHSGSKSYRVTGTKLDGSRVRENYPNVEEATGRKQLLESEALNLPSAARLQQTRLTAEQLAEAERAFMELGDRPLMDAVRFYVENYRDPEVKITLPEAFAKFITTKTTDRARPETLNNLRFRVGAFIKTQSAERLVSDVLPAHVTEFIDRDGTKPRGLRTKKNDYLALSSFFSWASQHTPCYCASNPMPKSKRAKIDQTDPEIMPLGTVHRLLDAAATYKDGRCLPYFTLGLFCALRPDEMDRITWKNIDLEDRIVTLGADIAKTRSKRHVEISDNAIEWLRPHALKKTEIGIGRYDFDAVRKLAGLKKWAVDIMRHTSVSHHLTAHQHEGKTALWAGNSPTIIQKHYKGLVKRQDAEAFWSISPDDASQKIVALAAAV